MAEEILVKEILSSTEIEAGEELLKRLDNAKADVIAAYWIYVPEAAEWHLEFVSPQVESEGPFEFYSKVIDLVSSPPEMTYLSLNTIMVLGPNYSFFKLLKSAIGYEKAFSNVWLSRYVVGNELVDMYIYRFPARGNTR